MKVTFNILQSPEPAERGISIPVDLSERSSVMIGREYDARLPLRGGGYISRHQAVLEVKEPYCFIRDLHSRNKTYVRGRDAPENAWKETLPEQATPVYNGDYIRFGNNPRTCTVVQVEFHILATDPRTGELLVYCDKCGAPASKEATRGLYPYLCPKCRDYNAVHPGEARLPITLDYELLEELGRGGMGVIYRARRVTAGHPEIPPGTIVAFKTIIPERPLSQKDRARFRRETDVCKALRHPHIVSVYDRCTFQEGERLWFVMEYVEGGDIVKHLPLSLDEALVIADQILDALDYAHQAEVLSVIKGKQVAQRGAVHRDIKPNNILIVGKGTPLHAKLTDFGLAKGFQFAGQSHFTDTREVHGTPYYVSPEHIISFRNVKPAGDIYAFGATLYTLLTGRVPYTPERDIFIEILESPVIPRENPPSLNPAVTQVIEKATRKRPEDRYKSAAEMRAALAEIRYAQSTRSRAK